MTNDLRDTLFTRARDQYETAVRWSYIAIVILLVFHVITFSPFVSLSKEKVATEAKMAEAHRLKGALDALGASLDLLKREAVEEATSQLDLVLADLGAVFGKLNDIVLKMQDMGPDFAAGPRGGTLFEPPRAPMGVQMPLAAATLREELPPAMSEELRRGVAEASSRNDLLKRLRPYVEREIIAPRFGRFNDHWVGKVLPRVAAQGDAVRDRVREMRRNFADEAATWDDVEVSVVETLEAAKAVELRPPADDPYWWGNRGQKGSVVQRPVVELKAEVEGALRRSESLRQLARKVSATLDQQEKLQRHIATRLDRLQKQFKEQQAQLASFIAPLKAVAFDLTIIAPRFPLLLGLALAAIIFWPTARLNVLARTVSVIVRHGPADLPAEWLAARVGGVGSGVAVTVLGSCFLFWVWIVVAAVELAGLSGVDRNRILWLAVLGGMAVAAASGYRWRVLRNLVALRAGS